MNDNTELGDAFGYRMQSRTRQVLLSRDLSSRKNEATSSVFTHKRGAMFYSPNGGQVAQTDLSCRQH
jgi:hypothetical protein